MTREDFQELADKGGSSFAISLLNARDKDLNNHEKELKRKLSDAIVEEASLGSGLASTYGTLLLIDSIGGKGIFKKREWR
jgi:hypothetical protein